MLRPPRAAVVAAAVLMALLVPTLSAAQTPNDQLLTDPAAVRAEVHANFATGTAGQVMQKPGFRPKGISCGQVCSVLNLGTCYEQGRPSEGTFGRRGPCDRPTKKSCWCDSGRREFGFFHHQSVVLDGKVYRYASGRLHWADPATGAVDSTAVGPMDRPGLQASGHFVGLIPSSGTKTYVRFDTRTGAVSKTVPIKADAWDRCGYMIGVGPRAWICEKRLEGAKRAHALVDPSTSLQHHLPDLDFSLLGNNVRGHYDGGTLWFGRPLGADEWDVRTWKHGGRKWTIHRGPQHPATVVAPDAAATRDLLNIGVFGDSIWPRELASMAGMGAFHAPRTRGKWIDDWFYVATPDALWGFDRGASQWWVWTIENARDHAARYHSLWRVGDTIAVGPYLLDRESKELRRVGHNFHAVWAGDYALIFAADCPDGASCRAISQGPFAGAVAWKADSKKLPRTGAVRPVLVQGSDKDQ